MSARTVILAASGIVSVTVYTAAAIRTGLAYFDGVPPSLPVTVLAVASCIGTACHAAETCLRHLERNRPHG
jgi:hypothetical protein